MNHPDPQIELPRYKSHKEVHALKIMAIIEFPANGHQIVPADDGYAPFMVSDEYFHKHQPVAGGYYVVYDDGYKSFSPAAAFESGYTSAANMARPDAMVAVQAKSTAPRVTPADIEANIAGEHYFTADMPFRLPHLVEIAGGVPNEDALKLLTFCVLVLANGFTVTGESACASPENFNAEIGRKVARENAVQKIWTLMGYALKSELHLRSIVGD